MRCMLESRNSNLVKLGGLSSIVSAPLFILGVSLHPLRDGDSVLATPNYTEIHILIALSLMFALLGLIALYVRYEKRLGKVGLVGFLVAFVGNFWTFGTVLVDGYMWPVVAELDPSLVHNIPAAPTSVQSLIVPLIMFEVGYVVVAIASVRGAVLPRLAGILIAVGVVTYINAALAVSFLGPGSILVSVIEVIGATIFGLGFVWLGRKLVSIRLEHIS
jgi:hypothetical protein